MHLEEFTISTLIQPVDFEVRMGHPGGYTGRCWITFVCPVHVSLGDTNRYVTADPMIGGYLLEAMG